MRNYLEAIGWKTPKIIAKIENRQGLDNIDEIIDVADGIMVARGDLGVEVPFEEIPSVQKRLSKRCIRQVKLLLPQLKCSSL